MKNTLKVIIVLALICLGLWGAINILEEDKKLIKTDEKIDEEIITESELEKERIPENYFDIVKTDGELETKYIQMGEYDVSYMESVVLHSFEKYEIWYPTEITETNKKYPVVIFANGTGVKASTYVPVLKHLASWGFIVMATEELYSWNGFSSEMCVRLIKKLNANEIVEGYETNPFYKRVDLANIGITGHSQGGIGVFNAITDTDNASIYKTAIAISPPNKNLSEGLEWDFDATLIDIPILLMSGTGDIDDKALINLPQLQAIYDDIPDDVTKILFRRNDADHGDMLYFADGYLTAWFMWHLQGDQEARSVFVGNDAEVKYNSLYQNQLFNVVGEL